MLSCIFNNCFLSSRDQRGNVLVVCWRLPSLVSTTYKTIYKKWKIFVYTTCGDRMCYLIVFVLICISNNCFLSSRDQRGNVLVVCWRLPSLVSITYKTIYKEVKGIVYTTCGDRMCYLIVFVLICIFNNCFLSSRDQRGNVLVVCWRLPSLVSITYKTIYKEVKGIVYTTHGHRMGYSIVFVLICIYNNCFLSSRDQRGNVLVVCWRLPSLVSITYKTIYKEVKGIVNILSIVANRKTCINRL